MLLVEDNDINALLAQRLLEKGGCKVERCRNGAEAVHAFKRMLDGQEPVVDLVLMDLHMPVLDGLEALRAICVLYMGDKRKMPADRGGDGQRLRGGPPPVPRRPAWTTTSPSRSTATTSIAY